MKLYFNILLEFDRKKIHQTIERAVMNGQKGYVCAIESNNLTIANNNDAFKEIVNAALVNICDGSNIAWLICKIHKQNFNSYVGNDIFIDFISKKKYRHYFLGNVQPVLDSLKDNLILIDPLIHHMQFKELPFKKVEEFDYIKIAEEINNDSPDLIWISLGAPKQEIFMSMLSPYLKKGVLFGIGAAFNFNAKESHVKRAPQWMRNLRLEWLYRAFEEPKKNIPRYYNFIRILPRLIKQENKRKRDI